MVGSVTSGRIRSLLLCPPTAIVYSMAIFGTPILFFGLLLGFHDEPTVEVERVTFLRMPIYDRRTVYSGRRLSGG